MPPLETSDRFQDAVLWPVSSYDQYGQALISPTACPLKVRWIEKQSEMLDPKGNTIAIDATVVVDRKIEVGGLMWKGCINDLEIVGTAAPSPAGLMEVKAYNETCDVRGREIRRTVGLMRYRDKFPVEKPQTTSVVLTSSQNPWSVSSGHPLGITATVTGGSSIIPTGAVTFLDGPVLLGESLLNAAGVAVFSTSVLGIGGHSLRARYKGDQKSSGSVSPVFQQAVIA
jgi:Bacterial Ig-like domain (group 3)